MKTQYSKITLIEVGLGCPKDPNKKYINDGGVDYEIQLEGEQNDRLMMEALEAVRKMSGKTIEAILTITEK